MQRLRPAIFLFIGVYLGNALMPVSLQGDSRWTIRTALTMIHSRTADLRTFEDAVVKSHFYLMECVGPGFQRQYPLQSIQQCEGGRLYAFNPIAVPVLAVPFVLVIDPVMHSLRPILGPLVDRFEHPVLRAFLQGDVAGSTGIVEILISSFFVAASVTVLYLAALELLPASSALIVALTFAFGTLLWSLVSRALWQHSPSIFLNSLLVLILIRGERKGCGALISMMGEQSRRTRFARVAQDYRRRICFAVGFILALAFFVRPTNAVTVLVIGCYMLLRLRSKAGSLLLGG